MQASEGGGIVTDSPIVADPLNDKHLLLGSFDANCGNPTILGFHLSTNQLHAGDSQSPSLLAGR
jgi:hypothetical protein